MNKVNNENSPFLASNKNKWFVPRGYYVHFYNSYDMALHSHNRIEIMYVATGELQIEYQVDDKIVKTTILPNNYVFVDANIPHKICINNISTLVYNIEFTLEDAVDYNFSIAGLCKKESYANSFFSQKKSIFVCPDNRLFLQNMILIQKYIGNDINTVSDSYLDYLLCAMLILMSKQYLKSKKHVSGIIYVNTAVNYIYENYNRDITLTDLASICKVSPNYLNTLFTKNFGHTVKDFINKYRISRAMLLLSDTNLPIDEIRAQIGYHNKASFHQNFVKHATMPPKKFRQQSRNANISKTHSESVNSYWNT